MLDALAVFALFFALAAGGFLLTAALALAGERAGRRGPQRARESCSKRPRSRCQG